MQPMYYIGLDVCPQRQKRSSHLARLDSKGAALPCGGDLTWAATEVSPWPRWTSFGSG